ncbi:hypothetical protein FGO68_gene15758 [Halteria grandinella]|uniref:Uncharacterized protein n=1 Tax=Halteria grandinella TaxID=5974 RepID=A0A8J8T8W6_HALGN|nr:hypothetical protein FGO68_gene15758 [Halteria grandinella]
MEERTGECKQRIGTQKGNPPVQVLPLASEFDHRICNSRDQIEDGPRLPLRERRKNSNVDDISIEIGQSVVPQHKQEDDLIKLGGNQPNNYGHNPSTPQIEVEIGLEDLLNHFEKQYEQHALSKKFKNEDCEKDFKAFFQKDVIHLQMITLWQSVTVSCVIGIWFLIDTIKLGSVYISSDKDWSSFPVYIGNSLLLSLHCYLSRRYQQMAMNFCEFQTLLCFVVYNEIAIQCSSIMIDPYNFPMIFATIATLSKMSYNQT